MIELQTNKETINNILRNHFGKIKIEIFPECFIGSGEGGPFVKVNDRFEIYSKNELITYSGKQNLDKVNNLLKILKCGRFKRFLKQNVSIGKTQYKIIILVDLLDERFDNFLDQKLDFSEDLDEQIENFTYKSIPGHFIDTFENSDFWWIF